MQSSHTNIKVNTWFKFEPAHLKKETKEVDEHFDGLATFWFYTSAKLFNNIMSLFGSKYEG